MEIGNNKTEETMQISNCESGNEKHVQERGQWGRQVEGEENNGKKK